MASFSNSKLPPNLEKPPLFNSSYRTGGSDINKPTHFGGLPVLSRTGCSSSAFGAPLSDFKVPKIESELFLNTDHDLPSFKRPKISDESQHMQIPSLTQRDLSAVPQFPDQILLVNLEHRDLCHDVQNKSGCMATREKVADHFNPLSELRPLGLNLKKSPSLLDLIQRKLAHCEDDGSDRGPSGRLGRFGSSTSPTEKDKLKAANFPASKLRVGTWECTSLYDGDLVAKCYYAKRKLVWEVLDSGLKSKMEVQWSDISALKAVFPDDQSAVLDIELSRPPLFFKEINPQPRKHTLWHSASDFTDGQATICRHHSIQFPAGVLNRHFEKLLQCDVRLKALNEQTHSIQDSCFFDNRSIQIDRQHMLHYQPVLSDQATVQSLTMADDAPLQPAAARTIECSQSYFSSQGFRSEPPQHFSQHHVGVESIRGVSMEGLRNESLQRTDRLYTNIGPGAEPRHRQGGFQLQFAAAVSPSSVIDTRGMNESSSSSEMEEARTVDIGSNEPLKLHVSQDGCTFSLGPARELNQWASYRFREGASATAWSGEGQTVSSPKSLASEKQVLNDLSLQLLGEPIIATEWGPYSIGRANGPGVRDMMVNNISTYPQESNITNALKGFSYVENLHHSQLTTGELLMKVRESQWNAVLEQRAFEARSSSLAAHASLVELISFQPQIFESGP